MYHNRSVPPDRHFYPQVQHSQDDFARKLYRSNVQNQWTFPFLAIVQAHRHHCSTVKMTSLNCTSENKSQNVTRDVCTRAWRSMLDKIASVSRLTYSVRMNTSQPYAWLNMQNQSNKVSHVVN